jgi:hypothetical protein
VRPHGQGIEEGAGLTTAVKSCNAIPFKHVDVWPPQIANLTYLEMEQE